MNCEKDIKQVFADMVMSCGIKVGDRVRVIGKCPNKHMGWGTIWVDETMDKMVGKVLKVKGIHPGMGINTTKAYFPPFVLEKVEDVCDESVPTPKHGDIVDFGGEKRIVIKTDNKFYAYDNYGVVVCQPESINSMYNPAGRGGSHYKVVGNVFEDKKC